MIDHKTIKNRDAKAEVLIMIAEITDQRKQELIQQYHDPEHCLKSITSQRVLIGNWLNNAEKMLLKGATQKEMTKVVEHIVVLIHAVKRELNVQKSYKDRNLLELTRKYFKVYKKIETPDGPIFIDKSTDEKLDPPEVRKRILAK